MRLRVACLCIHTDTGTDKCTGTDIGSPVGGPHSLGEIREAAAVGKASAAARKNRANATAAFHSSRGRAGAEALRPPSPMQ